MPELLVNLDADLREKGKNERKASCHLLAEIYGSFFTADSLSHHGHVLGQNGKI